MVECFPSIHEGLDSVLSTALSIVQRHLEISICPHPEDWECSSAAEHMPGMHSPLFFKGQRDGSESEGTCHQA